MTELNFRQQVLDRRLRETDGRGLIEWLLTSRYDGQSFTTMTIDLHGLTGDVVSHETLRRWHNDAGKAAA